ncbi:hypothetical protein RhiirA4_468701 [Rhizophagus irregularis]|uniref:Uncharacterized protein n=1 Tax=Rhizophagus irregularis TaxID=588596 RepID=A0A2I1GYE3_9GLOM|nr:hypothetical protein RhiirA4_468701 [Rhizophagus irregularis]
MNQKIDELQRIASGLLDILDIHNAGKVHKDFHSGMCQPANNEKQSVKQEGIYGVLPDMAPEVLPNEPVWYKFIQKLFTGNEYISEETPYNNIPHNHALTIKICKGLRPNIFKYTSKLLADLNTKCWDAKAENRPTTKELYKTLSKIA